MIFAFLFHSGALRRGLVLIGLSLFGFQAQADVSSAPGAFEWDPHVVRGQLANGFSYFIVPVKDGSAQVATQLMVHVGSIDERDDQSGLAHMVEHMVFHASKQHPEGLRTYMNSLGWNVGTHYNAQTNFERTLYMLAPENRPERINAAFDVLSGIAGEAQMPDAGLESERQIILEEWRTKLGVRERMERQRRALLRAGSLYPERPTIGSEASIRSQPASALRAFYADWYRPGNMSLMVVGDVDAAAVEVQIRNRFARLEPRALPARNPADPVLGKTLRIARMQDPESGTSQVGWVFRFEADLRQEREGFRNRLIDRLAERMVRFTVRKQAAQLPADVESLSSSKGELGPRTRSLGFAASVAVDGHREGMRQILLVQERLRREGADRVALAQEIAEIHRLNDKSVETQRQRESGDWLRLLGEAVMQQRVLQDPRQKQREVKRIMATISPADVDARIREWLSSPDQLLFMMAPGMSSLSLPTEAEVGQLRASIAATPLPELVFVEKPSVAAHAPALATAGKIVAENIDRKNQVTRWTLANGDTFVWLQTPREGLAFAAHSPAGYRLPGAPAWQWQLAAQLSRNADLVGQAHGALTAWAAEKRLILSQEQSETRLAYTGNPGRDQLEAFFQLYAARQLASSIDPQVLAGSTRQLARQIARSPDSVSAGLSRAMVKQRFESEVVDEPVGAADLLALDGDAGREHLQSLARQLAARPVRYFLNGDMDPLLLRDLVSRYLAGIPRQSGLPVATALLQKPGRHEQRLAIGIEPQASVRAMGSQVMSWSPERAMGVAVLTRVIHRMLRTELREKESGIYRLNFAMTLDPHTGRLASELFFTAAPERIDALWARSQTLLSQLASRIEPKELESEIKRMKTMEGQRLKEPQTRFNRLQLSYAVWGDARYLSGSETLRAALDPDRLRALAAELALTRDMASVILLPRPGATRTGTERKGS